MRVIFLFVLAFSTLSLVAQNQVKLKGQLVNFSNQVEVEDLSEFQYLLPPSADRMIVPDAEGRFSINFPLQAPNYFRIGRNILYLSPGDDLNLVIDYNKNLAASFEGQGSEANLYLRGTPFPKGGSFLEAGRRIGKTPDETIDSIMEAALRRLNELTALRSVTKEFKRLEEARIKADIINSLKMVRSYAGSARHLDETQRKEFITQYAEISAPIIEKFMMGFVDASYLKLVVYRDICADLIKVNPNAPDSRKIQDWLTANSLVRGMQKLNDKEEISAVKSKITAIQTSEYRDAALQFHAMLMKFGKGDKAVDFTALNSDGTPVNLSSLKGKVIYIDIWATWCGPCMAEMPAYEKLKEQFKDRDDVAFISLSIDSSPEIWKKNIESRNATGYQWYINRNKLDAYNIVGIPRSILIDKDFKINEMNAALPSAKNLPAQILELTGSQAD
ncbi:MAG TPA: TlpA disulfide reductase family protein [Parasegetibacter sp.]